jgi:zinc transport system substrate-binding protein
MRVATILARSAEHDLVRGDRVAAPTGDARDRRLERRVLEWLDLPAVVTDEVMMVAFVMGRLEACDPVPEVDPLDEAELVHSLERPVHARDPDPRAAGPQGVVELLRRETAVLAAEMLDDEAPRATTPSGRLAELLERSIRPGHADNDSRSQRSATVWAVRLALVLSVLCAALAMASGCGGSSDAAGRPTVVASFYPLAWVAERVAAPGTRVVDLTPAGAEPHDLELTPRDLETLQDADLVLYLGHGFQPAVEKAVENRSGRSLDLLATQRLLPSREEGASADPHVWLDPSRLARIAIAVGGALHRRQAGRAVADELGALDREFRNGLAHCRRHEIVTSHAAFGYLADRYGLDQVPLAGLSPEVEPSPQDFQRLVDEVRRTGATTVFSETLVSPRLAETIAREAGAATAVLDPIEGLTGDEVDAGEDYVSRMRWNLATLRKALGCR